MQSLHHKNWIFLPGASGNTKFWQPVVEQLGILEQATVVGYPGFDGVLPKPQVNNFESLQCYVLDQIQQPSIVVAQSMGGIFAVQAALNKPELVQALVLVATSGGVDLTPFHVMDWRESYQQQFDLPDWFVVAKSSVIEEALNQITCPILLVWGDNDPISPIGIGQYLQQKFQRAELEIIKDGQHDLAFTHAKQVGEFIQSFILRTLL